MVVSFSLSKSGLEVYTTEPMEEEKEEEETDETTALEGTEEEREREL